MGIREIRVSLGLIQSMRAREKVKLTAVFTAYMTAGPAAIRTAKVSLVARLMRSPVRVSAKKETSSRSRCPKNWSLMSHSTFRLAPFKIWRIPNLAAPPSTAANTMSPANPAICPVATLGSSNPSMASFMRYGPAMVKRLEISTIRRPRAYSPR